MKMRVQPKSSLSLLTGTLEQQHPPWGRGAELVYLNYISLFMACGGAPTFSCRGQASLSQNSAAARERGCQPGKGIWIGLHSLHLPVGGTFSLRFKRIYSGTMEYCVCVSCSVVSNSATPWTAACQAPLSMEFSKQEYWRGLPCPSPAMEYYSAIKKNKILPFAATWMKLEMIILSDISQMQKDKYCVISLTCGI